MKVDIVGSILITLFLMFICSLFHLGLFASILLMIFSMAFLNYKGDIRIWWWKVSERFERFFLFFRKKSDKVDKVKSAYEKMKLED